MPFKPGQSGNPAGRPVGARNKRTIVAEKLCGRNGEYVAQLLMDLAEQGHPTAMRICLALFCPRPKRRPFRLPPVTTSEDALRAMNMLLQGVADGELAPAAAAGLSTKVQAASRRAQADPARRINKREAAATQIARSR